MAGNAVVENKVTFGLKNVHYALITEGADGSITFGTPKRLPGAKELTLEPKGETNDFYADDTIYYSTTTNQGYEVTLTIANVTKEYRVEVLGDKLEDGVLTETSNAKPKKAAYLFEFDGDIKATRHVLYNCTTSRPGLGSQTKEESTEPGTSELSIVASPRADGVVKRSTTAETTEAVYNAWYTKVFEPALAV
ncbi:major tail protein [Bacillus sp. 1P06AnD]|uniref:major tail protein n=1 Tax=Bacillus sp. 1P06AnD TaxID=3132208 RepID=UPI00399F726A